MNLHTSTAENSGEKYRTVIRTEAHHFAADEPMELNGTDTAPSPFELLTAALASCTAITLRMYLERKNWQANSIRVRVNLEVDKEKKQNTFYRQLFVQGSFTEEQLQRLLHVANSCPTHKILTEQNTIQTSWIENGKYE